MRILLIATTVVAAFSAGCSRRLNPARDGHTAEDALVVERALARNDPAAVYPFSVIPGGVRSSSDVRAAVARDSTIASHYAAVNVDALRPQILARDTPAYVSFRKGGLIYWTSRPVRLAAGERILTNGTDCVRGRCGNRISYKPQSPVLPNTEREPTSGELMTATVRGQSIEELPLPPVIGPLLPNLSLPGVPVAPASVPPVVSRGGVVPGGVVGGAVGGAGGSGAPGGGDAGGFSANPGPLVPGPLIIFPPSSPSGTLPPASPTLVTGRQPMGPGISITIPPDIPDTHGGSPDIPSDVPEPATLILVLAGSGIMIGYAQIRRSRLGCGVRSRPDGVRRA